VDRPRLIVVAADELHRAAGSGRAGRQGFSAGWRSAGGGHQYSAAPASAEPWNIGLAVKLRFERRPGPTGMTMPGYGGGG